MAEVQTDAARSSVIHAEGVAGDESDLFVFERPAKKLVNIDYRR
jgi:hypothetical protein